MNNVLLRDSMNNVKLYGNKDGHNLFVQMVDDHDLEVMESEAARLTELAGHADWCIAAVKVGDWNQDLTPWPSDPVFGKVGFGDGARKTLDMLLGEVLPQLAEELPNVGEKLSNTGKHLPNAGKPYICGYSLAGLFALWASYETDAFAGAAAVSPSVWYPCWLDYAGRNKIKVPEVYLSLGMKEEKTRNPVMATVGNAIREQYALLQSAGIRCQLDWNPGNHFVDSDVRVAKGLAWLLEKRALVTAPSSSRFHPRRSRDV